jgi:hypothetical protein
MKNLRTLTILLMAFFFSLSNSTTAQNKVIAYISSYGELSFKVEKTNFYFCVSQKGRIISYSILAKGAMSYNLEGRIDKIGSVEIDYDLDERIDKIDQEAVIYDLEGRLDQIGSTKITYDLNNNVDNIGGQKVSYNFEGKVENIGSASITYKLNGRIDKINDDQGIVFLDIRKAN